LIKLLFIMTDLQGGGAERALLNLSRHLDSMKYEITLLLLKNQGTYWDELPTHVHVISILKKSERLRFSWLQLLTKGFYKARKHDIIIGGMELLPTYLAFILGSFLGKPVIGWVHIAITEYLGTMPKWNTIIGRIIYRRLTHLVFVSNGARANMASWLPTADLKKIWQTIYNIFDPKVFNFTDRKSDFPIETELPLVISTGRLDIQKNFDLLIKAHALVLNKGYQHRLIILGEGKERRNLETLISTLGVQGSVIMPGFVDDPIKYMKRSSVFVLPSRFEGFGMVLLEAMSAGTPVISTDCVAGPREILGNNEFGLLVPVEDVDLLADAIIRMLSDKEIRKYYQNKGLERSKDFSYQNIIPYWDQLFSSVKPTK
jgi:glycosyltransferase involved in cell wall biosynthesis